MKEDQKTPWPMFYINPTYITPYCILYTLYCILYTLYSVYSVYSVDFPPTMHIDGTRYFRTTLAHMYIELFLSKRDGP